MKTNRLEIRWEATHGCYLQISNVFQASTLTNPDRRWSNSIMANHLPASFDCFPMEIKTMILGEVPEIGTLLALSQTSRSFHDAYVMDRKFLLSRATLRQLAANNVEFPPYRVSFMEVRMKDSRISTHDVQRVLTSALKVYYHQLFNNKPIRLQSHHCFMLSKVTDIISWWNQKMEPQYRSPPRAFNEKWSRPVICISSPESRAA